MNIEYYRKFKEAQSKGLKAASKENILLFINSFSSFSGKEKWVIENLKHESFGYKMRHELYESIVFPVLLKGYKSNDPWSIYWLAKTMQNIYQSTDFHIQIGGKTDIQLLELSLDLEPHNIETRFALLESKIRGFEYAIHEWPSGVLYAPNETLEDFIADLKFTKKLDVENQFSNFFYEVEAIIEQEKIK